MKYKHILRSFALVHSVVRILVRCLKGSFGSDGFRVRCLCLVHVFSSGVDTAGAYYPVEIRGISWVQLFSLVPVQF